MNRSTPGLPVHFQLPVYPNSCPSNPWCHPAISSSVVPFSSYPHPFQHQSLFQWVNSSHEVAKVLKCKSKPQWDITSHHSEWPSSRNLQTITSGKGVEKRECSCTIGGNVNGYSHYGRHYGDSFKNYESYHPSGSSQCTSPKHPVLCIELGLATRFIYDIIHVSMPFSQISPPSPSPTESIRLIYTSVSTFYIEVN